MYEYKFVKISLKSGFLKAKPRKDYHEVIDDHASMGWRLVQIFAPSTSGYGASSYFELIFEREADYMV